MITLILIALSLAMTLALAGCMIQQRNAIVPVMLLVVGIIVFGTMF